MNRPNLEVPKQLFDFLASNPVGVGELYRIVHKADHPVYFALQTFLNSIPIEAIERKLADENFRALHLPRNNPETDKYHQLARISFAEDFLQEEISHRRLEFIRDAEQQSRPCPYDMPALADLEVGRDNLVPLSTFNYDESQLSRNEYSFLLLSTTGAPNSTYWLLRSFYETDVASHVSVRLDPFLCGPTERMPAMFYRMLVYGRPLDWGRISQLRNQEFGSWCPDTPCTASEITEYCWTRRDDEIHFVCEEVPRASTVAKRPARYLHVIYDPRTQQITHFDGALRLYTQEELNQRYRTHVRNIGKIGIREKIFRIDEPVSRDAFSLITQAFFIWNDDVIKYFRGSPFESASL